MSCDGIREALSALLDGEDPGLAPAAVHRHLAVCAACQAWERDAALLLRTTRAAGAEPTPDLSPLLERLAPRSLRRPTPILLRIGLAAVAVVQLASAVMAVASGIHGASSHVGHEMASWDLALAVGFLLAAWRPSAAPPLVPVVAALVAGLVATGAIDLTSGRISASRETGHAIDVLGLVLLWAAAHGPSALRRMRRPGGRITPLPAAGG